MNEVDATSLELASELQCDYSLSETIIASACVGSFFEGEAQQMVLSLPQKDTGSRLVEYYIEHIHAMNMPFISVQSIWAQFDQVYSSPREAGERHNDYKAACFNVLMAMAIATASLFQKGHSILYETARSLFQRASRLFSKYLVKAETLIETIQGLLFLIQYGMLNPSELNVSYLISVGVRMCVDLQSQRNLKTNQEMQEVSRKLHWAMYKFDRSFCIARSVPCTFPDEGWKLRVHDEDSLYHAQTCRITQLQSAIFDQLHTNSQASLDSVEFFATRVAEWDQKNAQLTDFRFIGSLKMEIYHSMILLYRPCRALKKRSPQDVIHLWVYSLGFAQTQRDCAGQILDLLSSAERAFTAGIALIYAYQEIVCRKDYQYTKSVAPVRFSLLWTGVQNVCHILQVISHQWKYATNILHRFETIVEKSLSAVEDLMNGCENVTFPSDVDEIWRHASVTNDLRYNIETRHREQDEIGELAWDIIRSRSETGQQILI